MRLRSGTELSVDELVFQYRSLMHRDPPLPAAGRERQWCRFVSLYLNHCANSSGNFNHVCHLATRMYTLCSSDIDTLPSDPHMLNSAIEQLLATTSPGTRIVCEDEVLLALIDSDLLLDGQTLLGSAFGIGPDVPGKRWLSRQAALKSHLLLVEFPDERSLSIGVRKPLPAGGLFAYPPIHGPYAIPPVLGYIEEATSLEEIMLLPTQALALSAHQQEVYRTLRSDGAAATVALEAAALL